MKTKPKEDYTFSESLKLALAAFVLHYAMLGWINQWPDLSALSHTSQCGVAAVAVVMAAAWGVSAGFSLVCFCVAVAKRLGLVKTDVVNDG
jgi:hypothetical protein